MGLGKKLMSRISYSKSLKNLYRNSKITKCLILTLNSLIKEGKISNKLATYILNKFDLSLRESFKLQTEATVKLKGQIESYNNVQHLWLFYVRDASITIDEGKIKHGRERYEE